MINKNAKKNKPTLYIYVIYYGCVQACVFARTV